MNSIQNNPTRYTKRETYRSGVDGEPGASLGGSSGSLEVDLFVRATIHWCGEERGASVSSSVLLDWTSKEIDEKIRDQASSHPYGMKFQNPHSRPLRAFVRKKETTTKTRRLRPRVLGRIESREHFRARCVRVFSSRRGKKIHPRVRVVVVYVVVVVGGFSACVIHLFVFGAEKKRPSLQKNKNEKIHSLYRAFCVGKRSRSRSRDRKRVLGAGANGWGRTLEVSFAEATVDVKENIFVFAVCLSMCFVRKVGKENGRWKKTGEKKNLKRRGFRV